MGVSTAILSSLSSTGVNGKQPAGKLRNPWHRVQSLVKEPPRLLAVDIITAVHFLEKAPCLRGESISLPTAVDGKFTLIDGQGPSQNRKTAQSIVRHLAGSEPQVVQVLPRRPGFRCGLVGGQSEIGGCHEIWHLLPCNQFRRYKDLAGLPQTGKILPKPWPDFVPGVDDEAISVRPTGNHVFKLIAGRPSLDVATKQHDPLARRNAQATPKGVRLLHLTRRRGDWGCNNAIRVDCVFTTERRLALFVLKKDHSCCTGTPLFDLQQGVLSQTFQLVAKHQFKRNICNGNPSPGIQTVDDADTARVNPNRQVIVTHSANSEPYQVLIPAPANKQWRKSLREQSPDGCLTAESVGPKMEGASVPSLELDVRAKGGWRQDGIALGEKHMHFGAEGIQGFEEQCHCRVALDIGVGIDEENSWGCHVEGARGSRVHLIATRRSRIELT